MLFVSFSSALPIVCSSVTCCSEAVLAKHLAWTLKEEKEWGEKHFRLSEASAASILARYGPARGSSFIMCHTMLFKSAWRLTTWKVAVISFVYTMGEIGRNTSSRGNWTDCQYYIHEKWATDIVPFNCYLNLLVKLEKNNCWIISLSFCPFNALTCLIVNH